MIPPVLKEVVDYLSKADFQLVTTGQDGRLSSSQSERHVVQLLQNSNRWNVFSPNVERGNNRTWYDVRIDNFYVDIKISACKTSDNTNAKKAIYYFLTGKPPEQVSNTESKFFQEMRKHESPDENRDYYYLIINKNDLSDVFAVNLKGLPHTSPNGRNLPFQSNWGKCRTPENRNWRDARDFLLSAWAKSIRKAIDGHRKGMMAHYPELFKQKAP